MASSSRSPSPRRRGEDPSLVSAISLTAQDLDVGDTAKVDVGPERPGFTTTSAAELRKLYQNALRDRNMQAYLASGAKELGDDYPGRPRSSERCLRSVTTTGSASTSSPGASTATPVRIHAPWPWAWKNLTPYGGDARAWKNNWIKRGWPTGSTPVVGSVAWFNYNHVAYVSGILPDGSVLIEEYNGSGTHVLRPADPAALADSAVPLRAPSLSRTSSSPPIESGGQPL